MDIDLLTCEVSEVRAWPAEFRPKHQGDSSKWEIPLLPRRYYLPYYESEYRGYIEV